MENRNSIVKQWMTIGAEIVDARKKMEIESSERFLFY